MAGKPIYPMAYKIKPGRVETIYYIGFPSAWKQELINIARANNSKFKIEFGLPTHALQKLIDSWMEGIVAMSTLKEYTDDSRWLASTMPFDEKRIHILFEILKVWINGTYVSMQKVNPIAKQKAKDLCLTMKEEDFYGLRTEQNVCLSTEDGRVSDEAYQAIPLIVVNKLVGQDVDIGARTLHLLYAAKNELVSNVIVDEKSGHAYSFVFQFSVQTTPPQRQALLLCNISIRRWITERINKERDPFLKNAILAHVKVGKDKICQIPIQYNFQTRGLEWKAQDSECYDLYGYTPLPSICDIWSMVEDNNNQYFLPYANGMDGFKKSRIGTGVPVRDKAEAYERFLGLLSDYIDKPENPSRISRQQKLRCYKAPKDYGTREDFREWVASCAETKHIRFELYGMLDNCTHNALLDEVCKKIYDDFGEGNEGSCITIEVVKKEIGDIADAIENKYDKPMRCDEIREKLGDTSEVVASICIIPGPDFYKADSDPKLIIRNAFARSGRVVQFMVASEAEETNNEQKVLHAVHDLYRQLGIVMLMDLEKVQTHKLKDVCCVGMHVCTQVHGISNKARFMPVFVSVDLCTGTTRVKCDAFENNNVNYRQACIEMAKLFWNKELEYICKNAQFSPAKQKLIEMKNRYSDVDSGAVILVHSDGNTRHLWNGISDKTIGSYSSVGEYMPAEIDAGSNKTPYMMSLNGTGIRIIRVRDNSEVPDYYTSQREDDNYSSATGVFKYGDVFWAISPKPYDPKYNRSLKESRFDHPYADYAEKDMIEMYPIQLQSGDNPDAWAKLVSDLCTLSIQYEQSTILPLPLHLAKNLTEYLLEI